MLVLVICVEDERSRGCVRGRRQRWCRHWGCVVVILSSCRRRRAVVVTVGGGGEMEEEEGE